MVLRLSALSTGRFLLPKYTPGSHFFYKLLRRIFGPRRDEVTGNWRRLHNEELNDLYSSPNIVRVIKSRRMRWARHVARMVDERGGLYRVLVGKSEGRRPLGRPRRRWMDNIMMNLQEVGCGYMDWTGLAQDRDRWRTLVSVVMNLRVPWNAGNFLTSCKPVSCSGRTLHRGVSGVLLLLLLLLLLLFCMLLLANRSHAHLNSAGKLMWMMALVKTVPRARPSAR